jgi:signal transduction histidine kinase
MTIGDPAPPEQRFVSALLRVFIALAAASLAISIVGAIVEGGAGYGPVGGASAAAIGLLLWLHGVAEGGAPQRALERLLAACFATGALVTLTVDANTTLLALVLLVLVLVAAPRALPRDRCDRWLYVVFAYFGLVGAIELAEPGFRAGLSEAARERSAAASYAALALLGGLAARQFRSYPFATKLSLAFLAAGLLPFGIYRLSRAGGAGERAQAQISARVERDAQVIASVLDARLARLDDALRWLAEDGRLVAAAEDPAARAAAGAAVERALLRALTGEQRAWVGVFVAATGGAAVHLGGASRGREAVGSALASSRAKGLSFTSAAVDEELLLFAVAPIRGAEQALVAAIHPELVNAWVAAAGQSMVVFEIVSDERLRGELLLRGRGAAEAAAGSPSIWASSALAASSWSVRVAEDGAAARAAQLRSEREEQLALLVVGALAALGSILLGRRIGASLSDVGDAMRRFGDGEIKARAPVMANDEIGVLAARFNHLAEQVGGLLRSLEEQASALRAEVAEGQRKEERLRVLNAEHAAARDQAMAANRAKSTFLAQMSHELRTPLNAIIGYTELIAEETAERGLTGLTEDARRVLQAAHHLLGIISDILDLSKIEAGKHEVSVKDFDVLDLVAEVCETVTPMIARRENALVVVRKVERLPARTDRTKLRQSLLNLLSNAAKFTSRGQVELVVDSISVDGQPWIWLAVRDEGIGIPSGKISALFEPFTQVDNSPTRRFDGTGLGLAITRRFCRMLGGDVSVDSELGRGSVFVIRVPARIAPGE